LLGRLLLGTLVHRCLVVKDLLGGCHLIVRDRIYDIRRGNESEALHWDDIHTYSTDQSIGPVQDGLSKRGFDDLSR
jgi:hypothetical protein